MESIDMFPSRTLKISEVTDLSRVVMGKKKLSEYVQSFRASAIPFLFFMLNNSFIIRFVTLSSMENMRNANSTVMENFERCFSDGLKNKSVLKFSWYNVIRKMQLPVPLKSFCNTTTTTTTTTEGKKYCDQRLSFVFGHSYLVKYGFSFGYRTVLPGEYHIIQTKGAPLLYFRMHSAFRKRNKAFLRQGMFSYSDFVHFDAFILRPEKIFAIAPGTVYLIAASQKCLFSFFRVCTQDLPDLKKYLKISRFNDELACKNKKVVSSKSVGPEKMNTEIPKPLPLPTLHSFHDCNNYEDNNEERAQQGMLIIPISITPSFQEQQQEAAVESIVSSQDYYYLPSIEQDNNNINSVSSQVGTDLPSVEQDDNVSNVEIDNNYSMSNVEIDNNYSMQNVEQDDNNYNM